MSFKKLNEYDYVIEVSGKSKVYHINMLKEYVQRVSDGDADVIAIAIVEEKLNDNSTLPLVSVMTLKVLNR